MGDTAATRPRVSVVVPFFGDRTEATRLLECLARLRLREGDEVTVVDNTPQRTLLGERHTPEIHAVSSSVERSAYAARNTGIELAANEWTLLLDSDCVPPPNLLDEYFRTPVEERCGAVAGEICGDPRQRTLAPRYARARGLLSQAAYKAHPHLPTAVTANLLIRRSAWLQVGGFSEGMRASGADLEFSWRLQEAGWSLCFRPQAAVVHRHRETVGGLLRQVARDSAGAAWLNRRRPGTLRRPRLSTGLARSALGTAGFALTVRLERAAFKSLDGLVIGTQNLGRLADNAPAYAPPAGDGSLVIVAADAFPARGQSGMLEALAMLEADGARVQVEARVRASDPDWRSARPYPARFWEDDGPARRAASLLWLLARHPLRCVADLQRRDSDRARTPLRALAPAARRIGRVGGSIWTEPAAGPEASRLAALLGSRPPRELGEAQRQSG